MTAAGQKIMAAADEALAIARGEAEPARITIFLPTLPPSVNGMYGRSAKGRVYKLAPARIWAESAPWQIREQRPPKFKGPVCVSLIFGFKGCRRTDPDNRCKAVLDALVTAGVITDDNDRIVRELTAKGDRSFSGVRITITPALARAA